MKRIPQAAVALGLLLIAPSCASGFDGMMRSTSPKAESRGWGASAGGSTEKGRVAQLDDITNGLTDAPKKSGFFNDDGKDGDFRGRTENFFGERAANRARGVPEPNPPKDGLDRKMIYTASYSVMVTTMDDAIATLLGKVTELGGYLARRSNSSLTVRVPAAKFRALLAAVPELGRVLSESMSANDVTNQHTDLTIRLENADKSRLRLLKLLEKATKIEDMIKIEDSLRRLTGEIERMKGQLKLMNDQISFSTVTVSFRQNAPKAKVKKAQRHSRFYWINRIGIREDLGRY